MNETARKVLARLQKENPELLKEEPSAVELKDYNLDNLDPEMPPSEMRKLSEAIARRRMSAEPPTKEETKALMRRIGK